MKYIVVDKQEGFSWINDTLAEVIRSMGYDEGENWDDIKDKVEGEYEVIKINGTAEYILE